MRPPSRTIASLCLFASSLLIGCSGAFVPTDTSASDTPVGSISGTLMGGRQPIVGAHLYLYAAGTSAYAGPGIAASTSNASTSLLKSFTSGAFPTTADSNGNYYVITDSAGFWGISGEYNACTPGTQVYIYTVGGNPGAGTNSAAALMAALGQCPASGSLASAFPSVYINEVSTVAAAYAMAGFASDATHVSSTNPIATASPLVLTLAGTGIANAFANAKQLFDITNGLNSGNPIARATTPNGNGTVPQSRIDALANTLATCINSVGVSVAQCYTLFGDATNDGVTCTTLPTTPCSDEPTDTASAAINIAHYPTKNVTAIFNQAPSTGAPYGNVLTAAPKDWGITISFTGGGLVAEGGGDPLSLAIDGSGNVWNASTTVISKFSPLGVPASSTGYTGGYAFKLAGSVAPDATSSNVWIADYTNAALVKLTESGATATSTATGSTGLQAAVLDGSGNVWTVASANKMFKYNSSGTLIASYTGNGMDFPDGIAIQPGATGTVWTPSASSSAITAFTNTGGTVTGSPFADGFSTVGGEGIAIDSSGNVWLPAFLTGQLTELTSAGAVVSGSPFTSGVPTGGTDADGSSSGIAIDGNNNIWIASSKGGSIFEASHAGAELTSTIGITPNITATPDGIAVDLSGDIWYNSDASATLFEIIGAGVPTTQPLSYAVANSKLGARP